MENKGIYTDETKEFRAQRMQIRAGATCGRRRRQRNNCKPNFAACEVLVEERREESQKQRLRERRGTWRSGDQVNAKQRRFFAVWVYEGDQKRRRFCWAQGPANSVSGASESPQKFPSCSKPPLYIYKVLIY